MNTSILINHIVMIGLSLTLSFIVHNIFNAFTSHIMAYSLSRRIYKITGYIGIPLHEMSHLVTAMIFRHKIISVDLFGFRGTPHVEHVYNSNSKYQTMGNFFIAIAPMTLSICTVYFLLLRDVNVTISVVSDPIRTFKNILVDAPNLIWTIMQNSNKWYLLLTALICFYCVPSNTDFGNTVRSSLYGVVMLLVLLGIMIAFLSEYEVARITGVVIVSGVISTIFSAIGWLSLFIFSMLARVIHQN